MRAVDTNLLVRLIVRDDSEQVRVAEAFISKGAWIPHLVLAETIGVLDAVYDRTAEQIATAIGMLLNHADLTMHDADVVRSALEHYRRQPALGFSDCLVVEIARKAGHLPLGTFDRDLGRLGGAERLPLRRRDRS
ncbi:MAG: PIN domain-containing protein [Beijerinckiaceae bacterium]